jgi:hypothetical protein
MSGMSTEEEVAASFSEEFAFKPKAAKKSAAKRGKQTESTLDDEFEKLQSDSIHFDYERIVDAFTTRGAYTVPRVGDFLLFYRGVAVVLEAKETEHDYRLPAGNFTTDARARMRRRAGAGVLCLVVVHHKKSDVWRLHNIDWYDTRSKGSWDYSSEPSLTLLDVIKGILICSQSSTTSTSVPTEVQAQP